LLPGRRSGTEATVGLEVASETHIVLGCAEDDAKSKSERPWNPQGILPTQLPFRKARTTVKVTSTVE
jgi:hypothetical protein